MAQHFADREGTIAAIATPPGSGAIAVIRLSGPEAKIIADRVFRSAGVNLASASSHTAVFGVIRDGEKIVDEVLALVLTAPRSFTGEDTVEFSCHGSTYIQNNVMDLLLRHGARAARPGEFTFRAFMNRKLDLAQAEAVADVIAADSTASHQLAMKQMRGGFSKEIHRLREQLIHFASLLELELDFSEEDVEFANREQLLSLIHQIITHAGKLSDSFAKGNVIKSGIPIAIIGKPNVGKSTLLNLILNDDRAIVSEIPGTTRDTIEEEIFLGGMKYRLIDTAGLRDTTDTIEKIGVGRSLEKIREAKVILYVFDPGEMNADALLSILEEITEIKIGEDYLMIPVANKTDRYEQEVISDLNAMVPDVVFISAKEVRGMELLLERIAMGTLQYRLGSGDLVLTNLRHKESLDATIRALENAREGLTGNRLTTDLIAVEIRSALMHLGSITGEITTDDLLESVFTRFCVGK